MPNLKSVSVVFPMPPGDDRDFDTRISITVNNGATAIAADNNVAPGAHFSDPGVYGPFPVPVVNAVADSVWHGSVTTMQIFPNGHDTWITDIVMYAAFDDGTTLTSRSGVVNVNQDHNTAAFQNF